MPDSAPDDDPVYGTMVDFEMFNLAITEVGLPLKANEVRRVYVMPATGRPKGGWTNADQKRLGTLVVFRAEVADDGRWIWKFTIPTRSRLQRFWSAWWERKQ